MMMTAFTSCLVVSNDPDALQWLRGRWRRLLLALQLAVSLIIAQQSERHRLWHVIERNESGGTVMTKRFSLGMAMQTEFY